MAEVAAREEPIGGLGVLRRSINHAASSSSVDIFQSGNTDGNTDGNNTSDIDMIQLPQSTHSLLFTQTKIYSLPFLFALLVLAVSVACLTLAFLDTYDLQGGNIPVNVSGTVRAAQYISILIALFMEEEIPTGTYLLRMIPKSSVERLGLSYTRFVFSAMCRLAIGYLFLLNVFLVLAQSDRVLDIFYDMMALSFVSMIDDIAFQLAKFEVLGKRLRRAASSKCFAAEVEKTPYAFRIKTTIFVKVVFVFNFLLFLGGMISVTHLQNTGRFHCGDVTVTFGDEIWENAWVVGEDGELSNSVLVYSYFNGVYKQNGTHDGRPVYQELRKTHGEGDFEDKIPAKIMYCDSETAWVFTHEDIRKSKTAQESPCHWLLRYPETETYDLMDVSSGPWEIWLGVIKHGAIMDVKCNGCKDDTDCNLNGVCSSNRKCQCTSEDYYGTHCELERPCPRLIGETSNASWSFKYSRDCGHLLEYDRPIYTLRNDKTYTFTNDTEAVLNEEHNVNLVYAGINEEDIVNLVYTGSRWYARKYIGGKSLTPDQVEHRAKEYHAFWDNNFGSTENIAISEPTTRSYPAGVDFYMIGEVGEQYGPFGVLYPMQEPPGRGALRCDKSVAFDDGYSWIFTHCNKNSTSS